MEILRVLESFRDERRGSEQCEIRVRPGVPEKVSTQLCTGIVQL